MGVPAVAIVGILRTYLPEFEVSGFHLPPLSAGMRLILGAEFNYSTALLPAVTQYVNKASRKEKSFGCPRQNLALIWQMNGYT